jgi:hypothetical protein
MPNIKILKKFNRSAMLEAIEASNRMKIERDASSKDTEDTAAPTQIIDKVTV